MKTVHQLNDGSNVTLVDNEYDEFGRLKCNRRNGNPNLKTEYAYNVRSWTKEISGLLFNQRLYYTDGVGVPCYDGNISSMTWKTGDSSVDKGYKYSYDGLSRLTDAIYGEGTSLSVNADRFNEQVTGYDKNGNILGLLRYGQVSTDDYGLVDNLNLTYDGNQLQAVRDNATDSVYDNGMEFKDGANLFVEYFYDANGNLIRDLNKKNIDFQYNFLNLPCRVEFENGNFVSYFYDAKGTKFRTTHVIGNNTTVTDYCGNVVYENGVPKVLLVEDGYVSLDDNKYHFYLQDHQGNNRVVADENGNIEEVNDYYPFGGLVASSSESVQPYKYNGKELDRKGGLDWYDYGARHYDPVLGRFMTVDPMAEKYHGWSPYVYCLNNPIKYMDPDGRDPKKLSHWIRFGKETAKAISVVASVGLQVAGEVELGSKKVGGDVAGVKDGVFFHPGGNFDKAETKQGVELGAGLIGVSVQKKIKEESGNQMLEEQQSVSLGLLEHTNTETTPIDQNYRTVGKTQKTSETKTADLSVKGKAIIGIELSLDLNKVWDALGKLLLDK